MARKAARLERAGALTPRDRMWAAIRDLRAREFCAVEIQFLANQRAPVTGLSTLDAVQSYLEGLSRAEPPYVQLADPMPCLRSELKRYRLVRDVGIDAPRVTADGKPVTQGRGNELMWAAMKALRDFDTADLVMAVATTAQESMVVVSEETAATYCKWLVRAGYLACVAQAAGLPAGGNSKARYRFVRAKNTGPRPPLVTRRKEVIDGNTGLLVYDHNQGGKGCKART